MTFSYIFNAPRKIFILTKLLRAILTRTSKREKRTVFVIVGGRSDNGGYDDGRDKG